MIANKDGKKKLHKTKGKTLKLRFVVERLVNDKNEIVAEWLLLSNVFDKNIDAATLANWYYYRWKIESYFKLLKSSGFNLEQWQQKEPLALLKRLLIVSNACILVWKIANDNSTNAKKIIKPFTFKNTCEHRNTFLCKCIRLITSTTTL